MRNTNIGKEWLEQARLRFAIRQVVPNDDWAAIHAAHRGSFATFLGVVITEMALRGNAIGDSILFIIKRDGKVVSYPKMEHADFRERPILLCSHTGLSAFDETDESFASSEFCELAPDNGWGGTVLIAATDAISEWVVSAADDHDRLSRLQELKGHFNQESFDSWVAEHISAGAIRRDDCAILIIEL